MTVSPINNCWRVIHRPIARFAPTLWQRRGLVIWNLNDSPGELVDYLVHWGPHYKFRTCMIKIHDGISPYNGAHGDNLKPELWQRLRQTGWIVGGWGWNMGSPEAEVYQLHSLFSMLHFSFYVADAEAPYEYSIGPGNFSPEQYGRSKRFTRSFRNTFPTMPLGLTSYGLVSLHDIDWRSWANAGARWLPQAYRNESLLLTPAACVENGTRYFKRERIHPMIAAYAGALGKLSDYEWLAELHDAHSLGFTIFPASGLSEEDFALYAQSKAAI